MSLPILLIVLSLATYRLTRLVTTDTFPPILLIRDKVAGGWREATQGEIDRRHPGLESFEDVPHRYIERAKWSPQWLADLISCTWCSSGWMSLGVVTLTAIFSSVPDPILVWPAVWGAAALLAAQDWS